LFGQRQAAAEVVLDVRQATLITVDSRNATIDTITATTIARLVGVVSRNVTARARSARDDDRAPDPLRAL
jgi:ABC-type ATPase with predicted acetyltransferase domain